MKTFLLTATYLVGIGELALAVFFWVTHSKSEIRKVMALLAFSTGMWVILSALTSYVSYSELGKYQVALVYVFGLVLLTCLVHLTLIFPFRLIHLDRFHVFLMYVPVIIFSYISLATSLIVLTFTGDPNNVGDIVGGPLYGLYNIYAFILFIASIIILITRARKLDGLHRKNIQIFGWSVFLGGLPGVIFYLLIPTFSPQIIINSLFGVLSSLIWVSGTTYIINRR